MKIDPSQYNSFQEYVDDMPSGIKSWISDRTDITKMTLSRLYHNQHIPYASTVKKICECTGLRPEIFATREE